MSEWLAQRIKEIRNNPKFIETWVLLQSLADIYESHGIIDGEWLAEINERFKKQEEKS